MTLRTELFMNTVDPTDERFVRLLAAEGKTIEDFQEEVIERTQEFCTEFQEQLTQAALFLPEKTMVFVAGLKGHHDPDLSDGLSALNMGISRKGWDFTTTDFLGNVPPEELANFAEFYEKQGQGND